MPPTPPGKPIRTQDQTIVLLRWVLIVATAYLMLFHRPLSETPPIVAVFIAAYLASNLIVGYLMPRVRSQRLFQTGIVLFDTLTVSAGLLLTQSAVSEFFVPYFVVMLVGTFTERLASVAGAAVLISLVHLATVAQFVGFDEFVASGHLLRMPFLFAVGLFFGHVVQRARIAEREAERAREREHTQKEFIAGVSHDLKNPLGVIRGMAELLLEAEAGPLTSQQADLIHRIHNNAHRVITLALNLLDATRIEAGRLVLQKTEAQLEDVVEETFLVARNASDLKGVSLDFVSHEFKLPKLQIDVVQLGRAVWNLIDNAIKYTPADGSVIVSVGKEDGTVFVSVSDTGPGIPPERIPDLFERYHGTGGSHAMGSGLGLYIVKAIAEAHGGSVEVKSAVGEGTTFTIRLPLAERAGRQPSPAAR